MQKQVAKIKINEVKSSRSKSLVLSEYKLDGIPEEIAELEWLESLFISFNSIDDISFIRHLPNIKRLDLRGNNITNIDVLTVLKSLEYLDLDNNYIKDIDVIKELQLLETLYISNNNIYSLPDLHKLQSLKIFDISNNHIDNISTISNLKSLHTLKAKNNRICNIGGISNNINLEILNIAINQIIDLSELRGLPNLKHIIFGNNKINDITPLFNHINSGVSIAGDLNDKEKPSNNPLTIPPPEIVAQGNKSIVKYFEELERQGADTLYEAKMLIIGEGGSGKTSLVRKIIDSNADLPKEDETTFGIDILRVPLMKMKGGKTFYLNIWDFGGQEIYHSTHQFFLTNRSLYALLDDTRKDDKSVHDSIFSYWLQVVELLGGDSPLIIIQNEKGDRSKAIDLQSMQSRFTFIKDCLQANLMTNRGLDNVIDSIKYWGKKLPHIGETLPKQWIKIRKYIERLSEKESHITIYDYFRICAENKIPEEKRALTLSQYLHDLGVFLHYQDDKILNNILILNNNWATDAVYEILDDEIIKSNNGFFIENDLNRLWTGEKYKYHHPVLMALMEKFELCYKTLLIGSGDVWLAPQLLPITQPKIDWDYSNNLLIKYVYNFMPKGLVSRLVVRLNRYLKNFEYAWRTGMVIQRKNTDALIKEIYASRIITINVAGDLSREFITIISEELDNLNSTFKFIKVEKLIQCNCQNCLESENPHFYNYQKLRNRIQDGKQTVECDTSYKDINVKELLDGVFTRVLRKSNEDMRIFLSYAHADEKYKDELLKHLEGLKLTNNISFWDDRNICPGQDWDGEIKTNLEKADIILLLISADFIASSYILEKELNAAIERDRNNEAIVIPIFVRDCDLTDMPFMKLQGLPKNAKPIASFKRMDEAYTEISKGIRKRLFKLENYYRQHRI